MGREQKKLLEQFSLVFDQVIVVEMQSLEKVLVLKL